MENPRKRKPSFLWFAREYLIGCLQQMSMVLSSCSNASDALDKLKFLSVTEPSLLGDGGELEIRIKADPDNGTITIIDTGVGMTKEELVDCLGTIAQSGTSKFLKALKENKDVGADNGLIGQFVVGFYSAFLVAERIVVSTKSPRSDKQFVWEAVADSSSYTIREETDPEKLLKRGTQVTLYLREVLLHSSCCCVYFGVKAVAAQLHGGVGLHDFGAWLPSMDACQASCKVDTKIDGLRATGLDQRTLIERNLLKGLTADENTAAHDVGSLGYVNVRYGGYIATVEVEVKESTKVRSPSPSIDNFDQPEGGANALNINRLEEQLQFKIVENLLEESLVKLQEEKVEADNFVRWELRACWLQHLQDQKNSENVFSEACWLQHHLLQILRMGPVTMMLSLRSERSCLMELSPG
ncbi:hypothetical protein Nepgr_026072 [Nepenthes gracilis]|uniref:Uncharacterized protein n=1 Tax=Nepenthes gracilis TaxID=150966 RepID=A0AAD3T8A3_NEPGR|nr:hypothetical protein Nepgr_026072 [Nepenthes gracilis]